MCVICPICSAVTNKDVSPKKIGVFIGYEPPSIIKYLEPLICDMFTIRYDDYHFDETFFSRLRGEKKIILKLGGENKQLEKGIYVLYIWHYNMKFKLLLSMGIELMRTRCKLTISTIKIVAHLIRSWKLLTIFIGGSPYI